MNWHKVFLIILLLSKCVLSESQNKITTQKNDIFKSFEFSWESIAIIIGIVISIGLIVPIIGIWGIYSLAGTAMLLGGPNAHDKSALFDGEPEGLIEFRTFLTVFFTGPFLIFYYTYVEPMLD